MEASPHPGAQPDAVRPERAQSLDECDERTRTLVEQRRVTYERRSAEEGVQPPVSDKLAGYDKPASEPTMNRRGTEPYARWCETTGEATSPPTRSRRSRQTRPPERRRSHPD